MKISTFLKHFSFVSLRQHLEAIELRNEDGTERLALITPITREALDELSRNKGRVIDWLMTSTTLYIYIR